MWTYLQVIVVAAAALIVLKWVALRIGKYVYWGLGVGPSPTLNRNDLRHKSPDFDLLEPDSTPRKSLLSRIRKSHIGYPNWTLDPVSRVT